MARKKDKSLAETKTPLSSFSYTIPRFLLVVQLIGGIVGAGITVYQTDQHLDIVAGQLEESPICSINEYIDCVSVATSPYAEMLGLPVAGFGFIFFFLLIVLVCYPFYDKKFAAKSVLLSTMLTGFGLLYSFFLFGVMVLAIGKLCLFCLIVDGLILALFLCNAGQMFRIGKNKNISLKQLIVKMVGVDPEFGTAKGAIALGFVFLVSLFFLWRIVDKRIELNRPSPQHQLADYRNQKLYSIDYNDHFLIAGSADASIKLVEFTDFECPACKKASKYLKMYRNSYGKDFGLYLFNYPLDNACNPQVKSRIHPTACNAALAFTCVRKIDRDKAYGFGELLFKNQGLINPRLLLELVATVGIDQQRFDHCMSDPEVKEQLAGEIKFSERFQISSTPTIFLNGRQVKQWSSPKDFAAMVEEARKKGKGR